MRVLVMGRSAFLVRGLVAELGDHGVDVVGSFRSIRELSTALPASGVEAVVACVPGRAEAVRPCVHALTSVMSEHPTTAMLVLATLPRAWLGGTSRWAQLPAESAATADVLTALARLTALPAAVASAHPRLTAGELRVLDLLAAGLSNDGIAASLGVTLKTVETHVSHVFGKLGLDDHANGTNRRVVAALQWAGY